MSDRPDETAEEVRAQNEAVVQSARESGVGMAIGRSETRKIPNRSDEEILIAALREFARGNYLPSAEFFWHPADVREIHRQRARAAEIADLREARA